jgi:predicted N-acetyltransferase YhbS
MRGVRRIEGAAKEPDAHAGRVRRQDEAGFAHGLRVGRTWRRELAVHDVRNNPSPQESAAAVCRGGNEIYGRVCP